MNMKPRTQTHYRSFIHVPWTLMLVSLISSPPCAAEPLDEMFKNPPPDAKPQVWWHWICGNVTREGITRDLELMEQLGIGGVTQFHNAWTTSNTKRPASLRGPIRFMSEEHRELVKYSLEECDRLGMTMGLQICDGFGQTGGVDQAGTGHESVGMRGRQRLVGNDV